MSAAATLLIVDDNELNRNLLRDFVISLGHEFVVAADGASALSAMRDAPPDLVLLDILMPGMDGHQVLAHMKADDALRSLPVIVVSALNDMSSVLQAIEQGADDYLVNPINLALLKARLGACLEKKRLHDREQRLHAELAASHERLKKAELGRDKLTGMVVHDLNNPLTNVMFSADLLLSEAARGPVERESLLKYLEIISRASVDMKRLTQTILETSKLESGQLKPSAAPLDAVALVAETCSGFAARATAVGSRLKPCEQTEPLMVLADRELLSRVLENLLANALKHTLSGTTVTVSLQRHEDTIVFSVTDDGPGIPKELQERVFDEYFQVELKKAGVMRGVGLGLTFCRLAVEAQGGEIWVESDVGEGTSVRLTLPIPVSTP